MDTHFENNNGRTTMNDEQQWIEQQWMIEQQWIDRTTMDTHFVLTFRLPHYSPGMSKQSVCPLLFYR